MATRMPRCRRARSTATSSGSSSCPTRRCADPPIRMRWCWSSWRPPTPLHPGSGSGRRRRLRRNDDLHERKEDRMKHDKRREREANESAEAEAAAAIAATETDDAFVDADESLESDEEPG